jgi:RHS repeat-associated protein
MDYYDNGNIKSKSDMGAGADYRYGQRHGGCTSTPGNHALTSIGSAIRYCYDNKGNQTKSYLNGKLTRTVEYTGYDKPSEIKSDEGMTLFMYDAGHKRFKRIDRLNDKNTTTYYLGNVEIVTHTSGLKEFKRYVGENVIQTARSNNANSLEYLHKDHLGSINFITDASGQLKHKLSFDAFGKRRNGGTWSSIQKVYAAPSIKTILQITERGFTGHEHVDHANVIHMNGRIYDPETGRFMQADPMVQAPDNGQSLNRYSYVFNNPLSYTDPTGYQAATQQGGSGESIDAKVKQLQRKIRSYSGRLHAAPPNIRKALTKLAQKFGGLQNVKLKATSGGSVQSESQSSDRANTDTLGNGDDKTDETPVFKGENLKTEYNSKGDPISRVLTNDDDESIPQNGYKYMDDAAKAALTAAKIIGSNSREYGGGIIELDDGSFLFTQPVTTSKSHKFDAEIQLKEGKLVGLYHTHPKDRDSEKFSGIDIDIAEQLEVISYIGVHKDNNIRFFDQETMRTRSTGRGSSRRIYAKGEILCEDCF